MRGIVAKMLRRDTQGGSKAYQRSRKGVISLVPGCWRANYQALKRLFREAK